MCIRDRAPIRNPPIRNPRSPLLLERGRPFMHTFVSAASTWSMLERLKRHNEASAVPRDARSASAPD
eukprot:3975202-Alexandrium_andersonii.AAC.1